MNKWLLSRRDETGPLNLAGSAAGLSLIFVDGWLRIALLTITACALMGHVIALHFEDKLNVTRTVCATYGSLAAILAIFEQTNGVVFATVSLTFGYSLFFGFAIVNRPRDQENWSIGGVCAVLTTLLPSTLHYLHGLASRAGAT